MHHEIKRRVCVTIFFLHMHVWKKHSARFSLFWFLLFSWNMLCLRKSRCTITISFKLNYPIQFIDREWAKHHFFFCVLVRNIWHFPGSLNSFVFLLAMKTSEPASLENYKFSNNIFIELSNKQHSICIYVFAVVRFTVFLPQVECNIDDNYAVISLLFAPAKAEY